MPAVESWDQLFTANLDRAGAFLHAVGKHGRFTDRTPRILDIGCGDGVQTLLLAGAFPDSTITGLDISPISIRQAEQRRAASPHGHLLDFHCADYTQAPLDGYDLIVADTCLHLIPAPSDALFGKIARELRPGGLLIFSIPYRCFGNAVLRGTRTVLRLVRSRWSDGLILGAAALLHGRHKSRDFLRERIHYMYILPQCYADRRLHTQLEGSHGLELVAREPYPHTTVGQFKHVVWVCRKDG